MKHLFNPYLLLLLGGVLLGGCIDSYLPDVAATTQSYLVVDGFINSQGSTSIKLSRSLGVAAGSAIPVETKATVYIRDNTGLRYTLAENPAGTYTSAALTLNPARQYQLLVNTTKGRSYASDLVPVKTTPAIDSLTWQPEGSGVQINVNTHDASNATYYYRWDYSETWQFTSAFFSTFEYVRGSNSIQPRTSNIYTCWRTEPSTVIKQTNTTKLAQDVVAAYPLAQLPFNEKLLIKYSILVQQHAQTQAEYEYWETLSKNTQNLGTLNDPLPTQLTGNVHCLSDASEPVLGYVGAHSVTQKRLFIDYNDLPRPAIVNVPYDRCSVDTVYVRDALDIFKTGAYTPFAGWYDKNQRLIAYFASTTTCVDCRLRGTNVKPSFWP
jgi:hypothetical protein